MHTYMHKYIHMYIHTCIHTYTICTYMHTYRTWENFGGGNFWRINGSKVIDEEKFGESVGSILKILAFINVGGENIGELPTVRQIRQNFPPPKFSHVRYLICVWLALWCKVNRDFNFWKVESLLINPVVFNFTQ